jgi:hypothetical protein
MPAMPERRKYPRIEVASEEPLVRLQVNVYLGGTPHGTGQVMDLSEEGAFLKTDADVSRFRPTYLYLSIGNQRVCEARGIVAWLSEEGVGIHFPEPNHAFRELVRELADLDASGRGNLLREMARREVHFD